MVVFGQLMILEGFSSLSDSMVKTNFSQFQKCKVMWKVFIVPLWHWLSQSSRWHWKRYSTKATQTFQHCYEALMICKCTPSIGMQIRHPEQYSLLPNLAHLLQPEKKPLESRPGFYSAKLGHKHIHNLSGISSSTTKKLSLLYIWVVVKPEKRTRYWALKIAKARSCTTIKVTWALMPQQTDAEFESTDKRRKVFFFSWHYNR